MEYQVQRNEGLLLDVGKSIVFATMNNYNITHDTVLILKTMKKMDKRRNIKIKKYKAI